MHDSMGECVRLARSGSRQNEEGTIVIGLSSADAMLHGEPLLPIEFLKIGRRHRRIRLTGDQTTNHAALWSATGSEMRDCAHHMPWVDAGTVLSVGCRTRAGRWGNPYM